MTIKYATKCVVKYKGYIINRTMYRPTVYKTKLNEIIVNSNEPMQSATGSMPTAHRQTKGEVGRSGIVLTFKNRASYIQDGRTATLQMLHFIYFFSTNISTVYFKHAAHSPLFSSKFRLFHDATFFGSCITHILHTGCAKI
jgi:hypothetical protein